jgi:hypothetical protein
MAATDCTPPSAAILAEQQVLLLKAHSAVLSLLFAAVFYVSTLAFLAASTSS